ncbi:hypothetical protein CAEBREN_13664 [Caenorhabditis brenneri]|uniref:F-box domain-containing protein n=1 Tax=Caenorhabditis brenneri TaxID=135651 RepID=G0MAH8_CAEBE|nr:hypothetical protein CAEBREN_13664 [Caenorhabditis brenneri]
MTFPIQKLPILVIHLVLQSMGFLDIFFLTRISTKMKRIVQTMSINPKHYLFFTIGKKITIGIRSKTNDQYAEFIYVDIYVDVKEYETEGKVFNMKIGSADYLPSAICVYDDDLYGFVDTFWDDVEVGSIELYNELVEVFKAPVRSVTLKLDEIENYQNEINWTNSTFPTLIMFNIKGRCDFQDYMWMIKNAKATKTLLFQMKPNEYPENMNNLDVIPFKQEYIEIEHGKWVSLQQLKAIESLTIKVKYVNWTDSEINAFLKNLKSSEEKPKFKGLGIFFDRQTDTSAVFEGLQDEDALEPNIGLEKIVFKTGNQQKCTVIYSFDESDVPDVELLGYDILIEDYEIPVKD